MGIVRLNLENNENHPLHRFMMDNKIRVEFSDGTESNGVRSSNVEFIDKITVHPVEERVTDNFKPRFVQKVTFSSELYPLALEREIRLLLEEGIEYQSYQTFLAVAQYDHDLDDSLPERERQVFGDAFSYYNFRMRNYEAFVFDKDEKTLPCHILGIYKDVFYDKTIPSLFPNDSFNEFSLSEENFVGSIPKQVNNNYYLFMHHHNYDKGNNYFHKYSKLSIQQILNQYSDTMKNVYVNFKYDSSYDTKILDIPFFNSLTLFFNNGDHNRVKECLNSSGFVDHFMKKNRFNDMENFSFIADNVFTSYNSFDLVDTMLNSNNFSIDSDETIFNDFNPNSAMSENRPIVFNMKKLILMGKLRRLLLDYKKDFRKFFIEDQINYSELMSYVVIKRRDDGSTPIQKFYFYNFESTRNFIDSQVQFNVKYSYEVLATYAIVGFKYHFRNMTTPNNVGDISAELVSEPSVKIIFVPITNVDLRVIEPPPLPPIVKIHNKLNEDFNISITLEDSIGIVNSSYDRKELIPFNNNDELYKNRLFESMHTSLLYYSSISSDNLFEVYRVEEPPTSYLDFADNLLQVVSINEFDEFGERLYKTVTFEHALEHQKKYYYLFRTLTHYDNPSNPSPVYVVEKYKDADETILKVDSYDFPVEPINYETHMRRFLKLAIQADHLTVHDDTYANGILSINNSDLKMGSSIKDDDIWNYNKLNSNYIKLRLESKNTGKKIDLNLVFNYQKPENI